MTKNIQYGEPPTYKGNIDIWINETAKYLRTLHDAVFGFDGSGSLDGDNITQADDPGTADGTGSGNAATINALITNLKETGIIRS